MADRWKEEKTTMSADARRVQHSDGKNSRRDFLRGVAGCALATPAFLLGAGNDAVSEDKSKARGERRILAYVGSYSSPQGPEGAVGHGTGIYLFEMNATTGALAQRAIFPSDANPSWLAFDPSRLYLYSANEISNYQGANSGSVSAYSIERSNGRLTLLNTVSSEGAGPAHLSVHPSGKYVLVANYHGGTVAVLPIRTNGELGSATDVVRDSGTVRPSRGSSAPAGRFALSGHGQPPAPMNAGGPPGRVLCGSQ